MRYVYRSLVDRMTGSREAIIFGPLTARASAAVRELISRNGLPVKWKFERYQPGTQRDWCYLVSDDEQYDAQFPHHPLTRVRRWMRRRRRWATRRLFEN